EVPRLLVHRRRGPPRSLEDPIQVLLRYRSVLVLPDVASGPDRIPCLHADTLPHVRIRGRGGALPCLTPITQGRSHHHPCCVRVEGHPNLGIDRHLRGRAG